jgi:hypothetical protein
MGTSHEGGQLFMSGLHKLDSALPAQCAEDAVDAIARIAVNAPHTPLVQAPNQEISNRVSHDVAFLGFNADKPPGRTSKFLMRLFRWSSMVLTPAASMLQMIVRKRLPPMAVTQAWR